MNQHQNKHNFSLDRVIAVMVTGFKVPIIEYSVLKCVIIFVACHVSNHSLMKYRQLRKEEELNIRTLGRIVKKIFSTYVVWTFPMNLFKKHIFFATKWSG